METPISLLVLVYWQGAAISFLAFYLTGIYRNPDASFIDYVIVLAAAIAWPMALPLYLLSLAQKKRKHTRK